MIHHLEFLFMAQVATKKGLWVIKWATRKASTTFVKGELVELVSNVLQPCTSSSTQIAGVNADNAYASSDATTPKIPYLVPKSKGATIEADTSAQVTVGTAYDLTDSDTVNQAATTNKVVMAVKVISATRAEFAINKPQLV